MLILCFYREIKFKIRHIVKKKIRNKDDKLFINFFFVISFSESYGLWIHAFKMWKIFKTVNLNGIIHLKNKQRMINDLL